jgi:hypothetical protein
MASLSGTVCRYGSSERIVNATVRATASDGTITQTVTDDDGDYTFPGLNPGKWSIVAMNQDSFPNSPLIMDLLKDEAHIDIKLQRLAGDIDNAAGQKFFFWLLGIFGGLIVVYIVLHLIFPLRVAGSPLSFAKWDKDPWRFLEIIMWGLGGVLVNKIINCGWFLRSQKFYREGIIMHIAHLVSTPLLVLVAVLLLSLATFKLTLSSGSEVTVDLSQFPILIAVSFLLGSSPWPLWNLIERSAKSITGQTDKSAPA